ncbi:MAG: protecting protein DprA protein [Microgenomates group bacterium GW2011_GWD1_47_13]|uniref:DNA protecting protein DprA n=1 Tax=Candidatus Collierbacteria bacterium RIFOXYD1_FULL_46_26 TaxID=1817732 RepID=A0A1F5G105_9BACT|nr:MAG: protecting protein DprA protein [Microgenomates group bacterium GW2011_GWF1_46_12]KKU27546.1 MAG: protecting protein DprA protein [Microgenomates group bacterium GW2011_GWF2_46_18]KKU62447.1 MAG: protecting protein DprA protein [Microgenomates group bacterium GW2011_GWD1_47_13]OGD85515.1 MAG: DNA protecting protein DprA [Candidatus Collierbacteria bacterium RIFOXYD1_FULL_46_26]
MFRSVGKESYPEALRQIAWVPTRLYYEGEIALLANPRIIAVVGTRRMSEYGELVTRKLVRELVARDWVIVSGLARGVDRVAHETCLANGGKTIAVLAHGLQMTYPPEHADLRQRIVDSGGLIMSEHKEGIGLTKQNLAVRNRIVVAIAQCVLVTESPKSSGTKITVRFAADQGKDVYVVPGPINDPTYEGSVELMRDGCIPIGKAEDIEF